MKYLLTLLLLPAVATTTTAQTKTDWNNDKLKGKVKSLSLLENYRYLKDGKFTEWEIMYNKKYSFDNTGRYTEYKEFTKTGALSYKIKYVYNVKDKTAFVSYFDKDEKPTVRNVWSYNNSGQRTQIQEYTKENKADRRYVFTYNTNGNRVMMESYKADSTLYSKTTYSFDAKGNETGYLLQTPGYANSSDRYIYDEHGNKTERLMLNGNLEVEYRTVFFYNDQGDIIEEQRYKGKETNYRNKTTRKYEYDAKGNWIKQTQYTMDGVEYDIAERKIEYYDK